jgi:hypothetical protein
MKMQGTSHPMIDWKPVGFAKTGWVCEWKIWWPDNIHLCSNSSDARRDILIKDDIKCVLHCPLKAIKSTIDANMLLPFMQF